MKRNGFTLIELLVVIAIISILAAMLMPVIRKAKEAAKAAKCISQLHNIGMAYQSYVGENSESLCVVINSVYGMTTNQGLQKDTLWNSKLMPYLGEETTLKYNEPIREDSILICPSFNLPQDRHKTALTPYGMYRYGVGGCPVSAGDFGLKKTTQIRNHCDRFVIMDSKWPFQDYGKFWTAMAFDYETNPVGLDYRHSNLSHFLYLDSHTEALDWGQSHPMPPADHKPNFNLGYRFRTWGPWKTYPE